MIKTESKTKEEYKDNEHKWKEKWRRMEEGNLWKREWWSCHLMGGNNQDKWKAATWEFHSHQDKTKGEEITLTQAHTIFVQSNFSIQFNM